MAGNVTPGKKTSKKPTAGGTGKTPKPAKKTTDPGGTDKKATTGSGAGGGTTAPGTVTTTGTSGGGGTYSGGDMITSGSTTAPATAADDSEQDSTDADMESFFSTGHGPAEHYHRVYQGKEAASESA